MKARYASLAQYLDKTKTPHHELAERLGVSRSYVTLIALGERQPGLRLALRIADATGVPVEALLKGEAVA